MTSETHKLSADIDNLFELITKYFYSNSDIFLRELVSNASDACDKDRYSRLTSSSDLSDLPDYRVDIIPCPASQDPEFQYLATDRDLLVIRDNGIGMTKEDLISKLSSIAHSGTRDFLEAAIATNKDNLADDALIGRFGVGFFSAFLVADRVEIHTFPAENPSTGFIWSSNGGGEYTLEETSNPWEDAHSGSEVRLYLKENSTEYLAPEKLAEIAKKYLSFMTHSLYLRKETEEEVPVEKDSNEEVKEISEPSDADEAQVENDNNEDKKEETEKAPETKKVKKVIDERINSIEPVWRRRPEEVTREEYQAFYKEISGSHDEYLAVKHFKIEDGSGIEFSAVLFLPSQAPFDMFQKKTRKNMRLYVKRVFIMDDCEDLFPEYLNFVVGVVDSESLDLNVSREILQKSKVLRTIKKILVKKTIAMLEEICTNEEKVADAKKFRYAFSKNIKYGVHESQDHKERLAGLLEFASNTESATTLSKYIERIPEDRDAAFKKIYYLAAENLAAAKASPFLEGWEHANIEVLLLTDNIDNYLVQTLRKYQDIDLVDVSKQNVNPPKSDEEQPELNEEEKTKQEGFLAAVKGVLTSEVESVVSVDNLSKSPANVMVPEYGYNASMERVMKAQALGGENPMMQFMLGKKILGLNMKHPIVMSMENMDLESEEFKEATKTLFYTAALSSGFNMEDKMGYLAECIYNYLGKSIN